MQVIRKNGITEDFNFDKIVNAITKSSDRIGHKLLKKEIKKIKSLIQIEVEDFETISVEQLHGLVEKTLQYVNKDVAMSYMNYRNYKKEFELNMLKNMESQAIKILNEVDRDNSINTVFFTHI